MSVKLDVVFIVRLLAVFAASSLLLQDIPGLSSGQAFAVQRALAPTGTNRLAPTGTGGTGGNTVAPTPTNPVAPTDSVADSTGTTASVSVGGWVTGTIDTNGDQDWYRVSLTAGHSYQFTLNGESVSGQSALPNGYLTLINPSGASVASDNDSGGNYNALLNVTITSATGGSGTYFLAAEGYSSSDTGSFRLSVTDTTSTADCLFNWAEANYSSLFAPRGARSSTFGPYTYRYYSQTTAYLAVSSADNHLYYMGSLSRNAVLDLGAAAPWYAQAGCR